MPNILNNALGNCLVTFSLTNEPNPGLRNKLQRLIWNLGLASVGTTLFEGPATLDHANQFVDEFLNIVRADVSGAVLTNFEVWFTGTQRFSYTPTVVAA